MDKNESPLLLLTDDDEIFRQVLQRAMMRRGFEVVAAENVEEAMRLARHNPPEYAVVDLRMPGPSGLELVKYLHELDEQTRIVVLTGYASIATAVEAIKLGAVHYLAKPATPEEILSAFTRVEGSTALDVPEDPMSVDRLEWEHIHKVLQENDGNISATARSLKMHRRTLQRKLAKYPVRS